MPQASPRTPKQRIHTVFHRLGVVFASAFLIGAALALFNFIWETIFQSGDESLHWIYVCLWLDGAAALIYVAFRAVGWIVAGAPEK